MSHSSAQWKVAFALTLNTGCLSSLSSLPSTFTVPLLQGNWLLPLCNLFFSLINLLAGTDKNDSADKVAEKLEELSVKDESKEAEKKETKENEEKQ